MPKIVSAQANHYHIRLPVTLSDSTHGDMEHFEVITVRLRDADGAEGVGYTYTIGWGGTAVQAILDREILPSLIGADATDIEAIWNEIWWRYHWVGRGGVVAIALSGLDVALWDLHAKRAKQPLWRFLGGTSNRVKAYAGGIDLDFTLDALLEQAKGFLAQGFRAIKMKVGRENLAEDVERVAAMRELLGPEFPLLTDANMRWSVDEAIRAAHALAEHDVYWLEEPTLAEDVEGHARILREGGVPIAAGENLRTLHEFQRMIGQGGVSFPEPDCANIGGVTAWLKVAEMAQERGLPVTTHGVHDLHVQLLAASPNASYLEVHGFGLERYMKNQLEFDQGDAIAPDRPGTGVEFDWDALAECEVRG